MTEPRVQPSPKSENRQRTAQVAVRLLPEEDARLKQLAERESVSVAEVVRQSIIATLEHAFV